MSTETLDVEIVVRKLNEFLEFKGFKRRDSDGSDFARPDDRDGLRFKTGTSRGEVTVTVWVGSKPIKDRTIRVMRLEQTTPAQSEIKKIAREYRFAVENGREFA